MAQSNYIYNKMLEYLIGNRTFTNATTFYVALSFNTKSESVSEPVGNGYTRVSKPNNSTNWSTQTDGVLENLTDITFPESTASWGSNPIKSIAIYDAETGGNLLYQGSLPANMQKVVNNASVVFIPAGSVKFGKVTE